MLYLKKYFTEGLIQMAILMSLCGMRVDVGLESYLHPSWHEMILGPMSALTQTQFHNLRNRLEDGQGLHPKSVDLDSFFTTRRLLGWVHSLDRLQVPQVELETWLVHREPDPLPMGCPNQPFPLERAPAGVERALAGQPVEPTARLGNMQEEEEEDDKETSFSLEECLRLLEETLPFTEEQQLSDVGSREGDLDEHPLDAEALPSPIISTDNLSLNLELHWQDLFSIMEPENTDVDMTSFDHTLDSRPSGTFLGVGSEALHQNANNLDNGIGEVGQEVHLMGTPLQHGLLGSLGQPEQALLPLTPSAELDDHISAFDTRDTLKNSNVNTLHSHPDHMNLLSEDFFRRLNAGDNLNSFNNNLPDEALVDNMEGRPYPANLTSVFLVDNEENIEDVDGLHSPLSDLIDDEAILDDIKLLDLVLEEGFSTEMAARLDAEGYPDHEIAQEKNGNHSVSSMAVTEDQSQPRRHQQGLEDEADSDSGLSLDFSHSPASPSTSEASSYSASSSSSSDSLSSCASTVGRPFSRDVDDATEEGLFGSEMEVEVTIKQEEEEVEVGAVGGGYPEDVKLFPANYNNHRLVKGFPRLEHIDHDHTYNHPYSSPSLGKMPTKHAKSSLRDNARPYHNARRMSETEMWSQDEQRARALKIPFSNELIVNLPVEDFNDLLINCQLDEDQLTLVRDIRRRGKNKIAAQNCRKRKIDVLVGLEEDVSKLRRQHSRLLREKQEKLRNLQEMKRRLASLYQEVFSRLRDKNGRPLDTTEYLLNFGPDGSVTVSLRQQGALLPGAQNSKKQR
uniref:Endoplasmic reticulum membrane sensor NFE2L1 n=1 Tax=Monopterus albus TaxID=43700 RepID=A0A3Q3IGF1_MONAL|nr:nuclear factor erythroid 2-related factor 1-like isoform X2 [Monopterus albus]